MSISYSEYLKNKNIYNNLLSQNVKNNSLIRVSSGNISNSGTIRDLNFYNSKNTIDKVSKNNQNTEESSKNISSYITNAVNIPSYVTQSLGDILFNTKKSTNAIKSIFDFLF